MTIIFSLLDSGIELRLYSLARTSELASFLSEDIYSAFCCVVHVMATIGVLFSNIQGYHQRLPELSTCLISSYKEFSGHNSTVWFTIPLTLRERGAVEGWSAVCHLLQRHFN